MSTLEYIYLIIILFDSNVEDAFSSTNTPDYTPASPNYSPALPGNTSSPAISPFHDDPYMKVMQAYNATNDESPIPPPRAPIAPLTVLPPSLVLPSSPLFDPLRFFSSREDFCHLRKEAVSYHSFSYFIRSAPPQYLWTGESSHKTRLEHHEEQIDAILNHLDELPLERIEYMEDNIEGLERANKACRRDCSCSRQDFYSRDAHRGYPELDNSLWIIPRPLGSEPVPEKPNEMAPKRTSTSAAPAMTQAAIMKLVADSVAAALEAQAANMENTNNTNRNTRQR
ncbi:hypothetical protein Tco_0161605 [Tanacetum coccineum]